ncbi:hypothetical protein [uncultured Methanolobus sp.]|uniref:hypothetical protein n=1 Tax=uncultured Methanolobus sp. TaxID=218300 RepID=UPI002AAC1985|nr:hypothetical protein [uncultured Methanolobus sp.]
MELGITKPLDTLTEDDLNLLIVTLQNKNGLKPASLRTYKKYSAIFYLSKTSQSNKTTPAKGIPLTWSTGFLNQLAVYPMNENPDAPLWVTRNENQEPMSYQSMLRTVKKIGKDAGIKKRIHPHGS